MSKIYIDSNEYDLWEEIINKYKNDRYNSWVETIKEFEEKINNYNEDSPENQNEDRCVLNTNLKIDSVRIIGDSYDITFTEFQ